MGPNTVRPTPKEGNQAKPRIKSREHAMLSGAKGDTSLLKTDELNGTANTSLLIFGTSEISDDAGSTNHNSLLLALATLMSHPRLIKHDHVCTRAPIRNLVGKAYLNPHIL